MRRGPSGSGRQTGTRALHERWNAVLAWSMFAATAAHAAVFALGPVWEVSSVSSAGAGMVSITPIVVAGARPGIEPGSANRLLSSQTLRPDPTERDPAAVPGSVDEPRPIEFPLPSIVDQLPSRSMASASPRLAPVVLASRSSPSPDVASVAPAGIWRDIRNLSEILQFLREKYNPVLEITGARGYATIAVWINPRGRVVHSEIYDSSGQKALDEIALELMSEIASFQPGRAVGGRQLTMEVITIPFTVAW